MNDDSNPQISALQRQMFTLLVALIVVSGTLTVFLYRQASLAGRDIDAVRPQAQQLVGAYNQNLTLMDGFLKQLVAYGQTHPDFRPVLLKYGINPTSAPAAPK
ncbi:MAG TPA: hypothetical protein VGI63_08895 [Verrucomicrobiae bacterium]|jgi:hypothetical protein